MPTRPNGRLRLKFDNTVLMLLIGAPRPVHAGRSKRFTHAENAYISSQKRKVRSGPVIRRLNSS